MQYSMGVFENTAYKVVFIIMVFTKPHKSLLSLQVPTFYITMCCKAFTFTLFFDENHKRNELESLKKGLIETSYV